MRARRHVGPGLFAGAPGRRFVRDILLVGLTFAIGYLASAYWVSPAPLFGSRDEMVPRVLDLPVGEAQTQLADKGFRSRVTGEQAHPTLPRGAVIWQDPPPETILQPGTAILLVTSAGPAPVPVPDVVGLELPQATEIVRAAGLAVGIVDTIATGAGATVVVATRPGVGSGRPAGAAVELVVTQRPESAGPGTTSLGGSTR